MLVDVCVGGLVYSHISHFCFENIRLISSQQFYQQYILCCNINISVPASPDQGHDRLLSARRGEGLSGGCKAGLTLKEDSFLLPPRPWPWCGGGVGSARCSLGTHPPCESSTCQRFKRRHVRRFGACAEADDTEVESWCVLSAPGV